MVASLRKKCPYSSYSSPYFPALRLNTEKYGVSLRIQSKCGKIRTRINPNIDSFYAVVFRTASNICNRPFMRKLLPACNR